MKRRALFHLLAAWALLVLPLGAAGRKTAGTVSGILLVTLDTTRADHLGVYGETRPLTPNIDRLARRGTVFTRAFSHTPMTLPAHANILSGATPLYHGVRDNTGFRLDSRFLTLAEWLRARGYATAAFVSSFVLGRAFGLDQGFALYHEPLDKDSFLAAESVAAARDWIAGQDGKWFCWLHLWDPHFPYAPPAPFAERYRQDPYAGEIAYMDAELGKLFSFLEDSKRLDSTLLVITGDHGESLGEHGEFEHGYFAYNSTVHIPLIVRLPGERPGSLPALVSHVDIFPTVCDAAGGEPPPGLAGRTLLALIRGGTRKAIPVYIESMGPNLSRGWAPLQGFVSDKLKFIDLPIRELYDLEHDFGESRNIISTRKLADLNGTLADLKRKMTGAGTAAARLVLPAETLRRLRSFGYLAGIKVEKKAVFGRGDDLKTLLPIQNKLRTANQLFNMRKYRQAGELYEQVIASKADDIGSYIHLAETEYFLRQAQAAVDVLRRGLQRKPDSMELKSKLGVFLTEINRNEEAVALLKEVLADDPADAGNWNYLGVAYFRGKNFALAAEAYAKALALDPENAQACSNLGALYLARFVAARDEALRLKAVEAFDRAIGLDARSVAAYNGRAAALQFAGQLEAALRDWRKVLELQPDFTDAYFNIAIALIAAGRKAEANGFLSRLQGQFLQLLSARDRESLRRLLAASGGQ